MGHDFYSDSKSFQNIIIFIHNTKLHKLLKKLAKSSFVIHTKAFVSSNTTQSDPFTESNFEIESTH